MTNHKHKHDHCKHVIQFCDKCDRPHCDKCGREWFDACGQNHYSWSYPYVWNKSWPQYLSSGTLTVGSTTGQAAEINAYSTAVQSVQSMDCKHSQ